MKLTYSSKSVTSVREAAPRSFHKCNTSFFYPTCVSEAEKLVLIHILLDLPMKPTYSLDDRRRIVLHLWKRLHRIVTQRSWYINSCEYVIDVPRSSLILSESLCHILELS